VARGILRRLQIAKNCGARLCVGSKVSHQALRVRFMANHTTSNSLKAKPKNIGWNNDANNHDEAIGW
jgi:hypothetical protein